MVPLRPSDLARSPIGDLASRAPAGILRARMTSGERAIGGDAEDESAVAASDAEAPGVDHDVATRTSTRATPIRAPSRFAGEPRR